MTEPSTDEGAFAQRYASLCNPIFLDIAREALAQGEDADAQARAYAERGKPDFALAYLLLGVLPEAERRAIFAASYAQRAVNIDRQAREWDHKFHRPFPLLRSQAATDRATARRIERGQAITLESGQHTPLV